MGNEVELVLHGCS